LMHVRNDIMISKSTHAGRPFAAMTAREHHATQDDTRTLGNWSTPGSFGKCYDCTLPMDAMVAAASFNGRKQESYFVARDVLGAPLFPCILWYSSDSETVGRTASRACLFNFPMSRR
jgi:hypothetical protein